MNLCYKFPVIFWNCACLITDAGGAADNKEEDFDEDEIKKARSKLVTKIGLQEPKETDSSICRKIYNGRIGKEEKIAECIKLLKEENHDAVIVTTPWDEISADKLLDAIEGVSTIEKELSELQHESECPHCHGHHHGHHHEDDGQVHQTHQDLAGVCKHGRQRRRIQLAAHHQGFLIGQG